MTSSPPRATGAREPTVPHSRPREIIRTALAASRPLAHANIAPGLLFGQALAYRLEGAFSWHAFVVVHLFGILDHLFIVFANDYADRETDSPARTLVSGGSGVIVEGRATPRTIGCAAVASGVALLGLGLAHGAVLFGLAVLAIALMLAYSYPPLRLSHRGQGEWLQGVGVGLVLPWVGYHVQTGEVDAPFAAFLGPVLLAAASHVVTAMPDLEADRLAEKRTLPVRLGATRAARVAMVTTAIGVVLTLAFAPIGVVARGVVFAGSLLPLTFAATMPPTPARVMPWVFATASSQSTAILGVALASALGV